MEVLFVYPAYVWNTKTEFTELFSDFIWRLNCEKEGQGCVISLFEATKALSVALKR